MPIIRLNSADPNFIPDLGPTERDRQIMARQEFEQRQRDQGRAAVVQVLESGIRAIGAYKEVQLEKSRKQKAKAEALLDDMQRTEDFVRSVSEQEKLKEARAAEEARRLLEQTANEKDRDAEATLRVLEGNRERREESRFSDLVSQGGPLADLATQFLFGEVSKDEVVESIVDLSSEIERDRRTGAEDSIRSAGFTGETQRKLIGLQSLVEPDSGLTPRLAKAFDELLAEASSALTDRTLESADLPDEDIRDLAALVQRANPKNKTKLLRAIRDVDMNRLAVDISSDVSGEAWIQKFRPFTDSERPEFRAQFPHFSEQDRRWIEVRARAEFARRFASAISPDVSGESGNGSAVRSLPSGNIQLGEPPLRPEIAAIAREILDPSLHEQFDRNQEILRERAKRTEIINDYHRDLVSVLSGGGDEGAEARIESQYPDLSPEERKDVVTSVISDAVRSLRSSGYSLSTEQIRAEAYGLVRLTTLDADAAVRNRARALFGQVFADIGMMAASGDTEKARVWAAEIEAAFVNTSNTSYGPLLSGLMTNEERGLTELLANGNAQQLRAVIGNHPNKEQILNLVQEGDLDNAVSLLGYRYDQDALYTRVARQLGERGEIKRLNRGVASGIDVSELEPDQQLLYLIAQAVKDVSSGPEHMFAGGSDKEYRRRFKGTGLTDEVALTTASLILGDVLVLVGKDQALSTSRAGGQPSSLMSLINTAVVGWAEGRMQSIFAPGGLVRSAPESWLGSTPGRTWDMFLAAGTPPVVNKETGEIVREGGQLYPWVAAGRDLSKVEFFDFVEFAPGKFTLRVTDQSNGGPVILTKGPNSNEPYVLDVSNRTTINSVLSLPEQETQKQFDERMLRDRLQAQTAEASRLRRAQQAAGLTEEQFGGLIENRLLPLTGRELPFLRSALGEGSPIFSHIASNQEEYGFPAISPRMAFQMEGKLRRSLEEAEEELELQRGREPEIEAMLTVGQPGKAEAREAYQVFRLAEELDEGVLLPAEAIERVGEEQFRKAMEFIASDQWPDWQERADPALRKHRLDRDSRVRALDSIVDQTRYLLETLSPVFDAGADYAVFAPDETKSFQEQVASYRAINSYQEFLAYAEFHGGRRGDRVAELIAGLRDQTPDEALRSRIEIYDIVNEWVDSPDFTNWMLTPMSERAQFYRLRPGRYE